MVAGRDMMGLKRGHTVEQRRNRQVGGLVTFYKTRGEGELTTTRAW